MIDGAEHRVEAEKDWEFSVTQYGNVLVLKSSYRGMHPRYTVYKKVE